MTPLAPMVWEGGLWRPMTQPTTPTPTSWDWSEANLPWAYTPATKQALFTEGWPASVQYVDYVPASGVDFRTRCLQLLNSLPSGARAVIRLPDGLYTLTAFVPTAANPTTDLEWLYAFGLFHPKLQGFLGGGPDVCRIRMAADSMVPQQLAAIAAMTKASGNVLQTRVMRLDGTKDSPVLLGGVGFEAADQQIIGSFAADNNIAGGQPAPHGGIQLFDYYSDLHYQINNCSFIGVGRSATSLPPFELKSLGIDKGTGTIRRCQFDGRRHGDLDPARPRRCSNVSGNSEKLQVLEDCWLGWSNISRYAANDQHTQPPGGQYIIRRCKAEQITNTQNTDPALNGGVSLGGYTNATPFGWESTKASILVEDCIIVQDNPYTDVGIAQHLQLTAVNGVDPQGGRLTARRITTRTTPWPQLDGWLCFRITSSRWITDGYDTTLHVEGHDGQRLTPAVVSGSWPPSAAQLAAIGTPQTHYLIRNS